jgi:galactokinase
VSIEVWAPGRVNLIGEHTDYAGGLVLPVAVQLGITLAVEEIGCELTLRSDGFGPPGDGWGRYVDAVAAELAALGRPAVGFRGRLVSTLPAGAGLSSSAALTVAVALALCAVAAWELPPLELADACRRAEHRAVGAPVGILDQAASLLGREGHALLLDCASLEHRYVAVPHDAALVVVDSGVAHSNETSGYADRRKELEAGMPQRVRHVSTENERVLAFVEALEAGDLVAAGELLLASHASLRDDYEVSTPELDALVEDACASGALGARLVGGGFGGSVLVLTERRRAESLAAEVSERHRARGYAGGSAFVALASRGAAVRLDD